MRLAILHCLVVLGIVLQPGLPRAETIEGRVVGVIDGDTLTIRDSGKVRHKVWLVGVDAPEAKQPFGQAAKTHLTGLVFGRDVTVEWRQRDRYGRIVGKLMLQPSDCPNCARTVDAGLAQIEAGLAWWYREYRREQSLEDQARYEFAEFDAQARRIGLWRDAAPVPPWEWRKRVTPSWLSRSPPQHDLRSDEDRLPIAMQ
ncbi:MAG: hypothetical protein A3H93_14440 [Rhodocyclales bacterium RIFCSPLOWO2_02_FULL_63_24]|nr:MAG: hypothetical protein A3H93_14440 [Rhodocyclales bacterium RIFCSPLOWO2_02_FULL_63_24]